MGGRRLKPVRLFSSDLDGTLAGDRISEERFRRFWEALDPAQRPLLVYNSGRLVDDMLDFLPKTRLPVADILIGGVGTMMFSPRFGHLEQDFHRALGPELDRAAIADILASLAGASPQAERYQHPKKSSWFLPGAGPDLLDLLEQRLAAAGQDVSLVYSSARDLDILPRGASKGWALSWLGSALGIGTDEMLVAGDTGNDRNMFELEGVRGIVVANALADLAALDRLGRHIFRAQCAAADGVIAGFGHFAAG
jgi:mannosylfructose-6-phosphate phosphatase